MRSIDQQDEESTLDNDKLEQKDTKKAQPKRLIWKHLAQKKPKKPIKTKIKINPAKNGL